MRGGCDSLSVRLLLALAGVRDFCNCCATLAVRGGLPVPAGGFAVCLPALFARGGGGGWCEEGSGVSTI